MRIEHMARDYYWALVRQIPHLLNDSIGRVTNVLFVVGFVTRSPSS
jgi:hypothetical protein